MTNDDAVLIRDLSAFFAMNGLLASGDYGIDDIPAMAYKMADDMMEAREQKQVGLPAIKRRRK